MQPWVLPAAVAFLCWGLWTLLPKITTRYIDPKSAIVFEVTGGVLVALLALASLA